MVAPKPSAAAATIATVPPPPSSSEVLEEAYGPLLYRLLLERNHRETLPFADLHVSNAQLWQQVDALQHQCLQAEREVDHLRQQLIESAVQAGGAGGSVGGAGGLLFKGSSFSTPSKASAAAATAALKSESRLRDKLEKLQEDLNAKLRHESDQQAALLKATQEASDLKDAHTALERTLSNLRQENARAERAIEHLTNEVVEAKSRTELAEKQYEGLKRTIRTLQNDNDQLSKENRQLEERLVQDKGKTVDEMNTLNDMVNALKMEVDMLRSYKIQEDKRRSWFGGPIVPMKDAPPSPSPPSSGKELKAESPSTLSRKWGSFGVVLPSSPKHIVSAHNMEGTCVRYDDTGTDLIATAGSDACCKVFDTSTGTCRATLRGTPGHAILGCDISGSLVVGGGTDKTCRVWNLRTERMIHHLVGHQHKITCVRLFGGNSDKSVISGSADRSLKIWDISRKTYRQTLTLRHGSSCNCVDVATDSVTAVSGHLDGGLRFWDLRSGDRTADISAIHEGAITSVQFQPTVAGGGGSSSVGPHVLTNSMDSSLKVVDVRTGTALFALRDADLVTSYGWSRACFSPDGAYILGASNSTGHVLVWSAVDGTLKAKLSDQHGGSGVCGIDWGRGGTNGQQVASIDRTGVLILWA